MNVAVMTLPHFWDRRREGAGDAAALIGTPTGAGGAPGGLGFCGRA